MYIYNWYLQLDNRGRWEQSYLSGAIRFFISMELDTKYIAHTIPVHLTVQYMFIETVYTEHIWVWTAFSLYS